MYRNYKWSDLKKAENSAKKEEKLREEEDLRISMATFWKSTDKI